MPIEYATSIRMKSNRQSTLNFLLENCQSTIDFRLHSSGDSLPFCYTFEGGILHGTSSVTETGNGSVVGPAGELLLHGL